MKKYELDNEQQILLERSFMSHPNQDGWQERFEAMNEKMNQACRFMMLVTPKCAEQTMAVRKAQEALFWFSEAIRKNDR